MTRASWASVLLASGCAVVSLAACGGSGGGIDRQASQILEAQVTSARAAVAAGEPVRAAQLLQAVDDTVASLREDHLISDRKAADVLAALGDTEDALHAWIATSTTSTSTTTTTTPNDNRREHDNRNKGNGKDDGD